MEIRCYQRLLNISYKDHITNATACNKIQAAIGPHEETLTTVKKGSYDGLVCVWSDHVASVKRSYYCTREKKKAKENMMG